MLERVDEKSKPAIFAAQGSLISSLVQIKLLKMQYGLLGAGNECIFLLHLFTMRSALLRVSTIKKLHHALSPEVLARHWWDLYSSCQLGY